MNDKLWRRGIKERKTGGNKGNKTKIPKAKERKTGWHVNWIAQDDGKARKHAENSLGEYEAHTCTGSVQSCLLVLSTHEWQCVLSLSVSADPPSGLFWVHLLTGGLQLMAFLYISGAWATPWPLRKILARISKGGQWFRRLRPAFSSYSLSGCPSRQDWGKHVELTHQNESSSIISSCEKSWCIPLKVAQNNPIHSVSDMLSSHRNLKIGKFTRLRKFNGSMNHVDLYCCRLVTVRYHF